MTDISTDRILRLPTVLNRTGLSRSPSIGKSMRPRSRQIPISTRCAGWRESQINEWMKNPIFYRVSE